MGVVEAVQLVLVVGVALVVVVVFVLAKVVDAKLEALEELVAHVCSWAETRGRRSARGGEVAVALPLPR